MPEKPKAKKTTPATKGVKPRKAAAKKTRTASGRPARAIKAAHVRVLCVNGALNRAIIGYGADCTNAYRDAENKARAWCYNHGGTQKITRVNCQ